MGPHIENLDTIVWEVVPAVDFLPVLKAHMHEMQGSITQKPAWVSNWQRHVNPDVFCVVMRSDKIICAVVSLEVVTRGLLKLAIFPGGNHANENFPCVLNALVPNIAPADFINGLMHAVKRARTDIDAVYLHRQVQFLNGLANPFLIVEHAIETDIALSLMLDTDFQGVLATRDGGKKQKKIRQGARRMEERGGWSYEIAKNSSDIQDALQAFYALKAIRLIAKGIANVFGPAEIQHFITGIFQEACACKTHEFEGHVLKLGGKIVAFAGASRNGKTLTVEFTAVDDTEKNLSHGEFLYFYMLADACQRGVETFSFGVGDEPFKRSWCDVVTPQYNTMVALTVKGTAAARFEALLTRAKRAVKSNKRLYRWLKNLRKKSNQSFG